ncbi:MAG: hypothetical protein JNK47_12915 [Mesorhizobium sp.]|nr:hypothetical protein [Mesorhizobium sp.]MBL8578121.1 hypothetical protein [Mesorhizobium sp.]
MSALIAAQLSVWHFRVANFHLQRGEAWLWRSYSYQRPTAWQAKAFVILKMLAGLSMALLIAAPWVWIVWRSL